MPAGLCRPGGDDIARRGPGERRCHDHGAHACWVQLWAAEQGCGLLWMVQQETLCQQQASTFSHSTSNKFQFANRFHGCGSFVIALAVACRGSLKVLRTVCIVCWGWRSQGKVEILATQSSGSWMPSCARRCCAMEESSSTLSWTCAARRCCHQESHLLYLPRRTKGPFLADYREAEIWHQGQRVASVGVTGRASPETFEALEARLRHVRGVKSFLPNEACGF